MGESLTVFCDWRACVLGYDFYLENVKVKDWLEWSVTAENFTNFWEMLKTSARTE
jgi:hypothetical protein